MDCDAVRTELLDRDWDEADRRRMAGILEHVAQCSACRAAMEDFDRLRTSLRTDTSGIEPTGGWEAFGLRIANCGLRIEDSLTTDGGPPAAERAPAGSGRVRRILGGPAVFLPIGLAASLLLAVVGWGLYLTSEPPPGRLAADPTEAAAMVLALSGEEIAERLRAFRHVAEVFDHQAAWVLLANNATELGLRPRQAATDDNLLVLRLAVSRGSSVVSTADLIILAGESARLSLPANGGPAIRYHIATSREDMRHLQLWMEVDTAADESAPAGEQEATAILAADLHLKPGELLSAGEVMTPAGRYEVHVGIYPGESGVHAGAPGARPS